MSKINVKEMAERFALNEEEINVALRTRGKAKSYRPGPSLDGKTLTALRKIFDRATNNTRKELTLLAALGMCKTFEDFASNQWITDGSTDPFLRAEFFGKYSQVTRKKLKSESDFGALYDLYTTVLKSVELWDVAASAHLAVVCAMRNTSPVVIFQKLFANGTYIESDDSLHGWLLEKAISRLNAGQASKILTWLEDEFGEGWRGGDACLQIRRVIKIASALFRK